MSWGAVVAAALVIRYANVMHPSWPWVGIPLAATIVSAAYGLVVLIRTARDRSWRATGAWAAVLALPALLGVAPLGYGFLTMSQMRRPAAERRWPQARESDLFSGAMGASLLDAAARVVYPQRTSGQHVVMLYKKAANPEADVAAMDAHVEQMVQLLGQQCAAKVHWVRGGLFGVSRMYFQGMSFGSDSRDADGAPTELDRHEIAHFAIESLAGPHSLPPSMLQEGWAQAQMGRPPGSLASQALAAWAANPKLGPSGLVGRDYYDSREYVVYLQGGAFVDFLLRKYGGPKFFELYRSCRQTSFGKDCERVLGVSLAELERMYGEDLEQEALKAPDRDGLVKAPLRLLSANGRPSAVFLWVDRRLMENTQPAADVAARDAFFAEYPAALVRLRQMYNPVTITATTHYQRMRDGQEINRGEASEEFSQDGARWRARTKGELPERIYVSTPADSFVLTASANAGQYAVGKKPPDELPFEAQYGWIARLLPHRVGQRDISEVFSDASFMVRDIVAVEVDGEPAVELRYERLGGRERGHVRFDPRRSWAVLESSWIEAYAKSLEQTQTYRFSYAEPDGDRPVITGFRYSRKTEPNAFYYVEETEITGATFEHPEDRVFQIPSR